VQVAEVQPRLVLAPAEAAPGPDRECGVDRVDGPDIESSTLQDV